MLVKTGVACAVAPASNARVSTAEPRALNMQPPRACWQDGADGALLILRPVPRVATTSRIFLAQPGADSHPVRSSGSPPAQTGSPQQQHAEPTVRRHRCDIHAHDPAKAAVEDGPGRERARRPGQCADRDDVVPDAPIEDAV